MRKQQAGTGPSRRHIQGSKIAKRLPSVKYSFTEVENRKFFFLKKIHTKKIGPSGAPGLATASPWRANVSQCRKTERGDPLRFFNIHSVAKHEKIEEKNFFIFGIKSHNAEKTERRNPLGFSNIHSVAKHQKKMQGEPLRKKNFEKKSEKKCLAVPKKIERGTLWSRPV